MAPDQNRYLFIWWITDIPGNKATAGNNAG